MTAALDIILRSQKRPTTLNPSDKGATMTLRNGNLTVTKTGGTWQSVRSIASFTTELIYFEVTYTTVVTAVAIGFGTAASPLTQFPGNTADTFGVGYPSNDGNVYYNNGGIQFAPGTWQVATNTACVAVNGGLKRAWFRKGPAGNWNNNVSANPALGASGIGWDYSAGSMGSAPLFAMVSANGSGDVATVNFGATDFVGAVPAGFGRLR